MAFQPTLPLSGYGGWRFLQSTYARQLDAHAASPQIQRDRDHLVARLSSPLTRDELVEDPRLLRVALTAFGLGEEAWKRGFVSKVLEEAGDPESTFVQRLNNRDYEEFSNVFASRDGVIQLSGGQIQDIADRFEKASFEVAVGAVDNDMRLSLNYQAEIERLARDGSSQEAILYRLLGDVPVRTVLESALGLPSSLGKLPIDVQADALKTRLRSALSLSDATQLKAPEAVESVLQRYHAARAASRGPSALTPGATALSLLKGVPGLGGVATQNLFASQFR